MHAILCDDVEIYRHENAIILKLPKSTMADFHLWKVGELTVQVVRQACSSPQRPLL